MSFSLQNLESSLPEDIIQKGLDYLAAARVKNKLQEGDNWEAEVLGTQVYKIVITIVNDRVTNWTCDCPYNFGPVCKHVAAVLFSIRAEQQEADLKKMPYFKKRKL